MSEYIEPYEQMDLISEHDMPENISITDDGSVNSSTIHKKMNDVLKKQSDLDYNKLKLVSNNEVSKVELYDTGCVRGAVIRLATSGIRTRHRVGSMDEELYFKVTYTGIRHKTAKNENQALFLYYETPEQWERHFKTTCSTNIKTAWNKKYNKALRRQFSNK